MSAFSRPGSRPKPVLVAAALIAVSALLVGVDAAQPEAGADRSELPQLREFLDDAPGIPARPIPGAPPAEVHRFGDFSSVQVNVAGNGANIPGDAANEPSLAVDPTNPLNIAIGWRQFDTVSSNFRQAGWAYSQDGGRTWTFPGVIDPGNFRSDPVLSYDRQGNFYYNSLESDFTCDVYTSTDGGMTWGPEIFAWGGDKEWIQVDRSGGMGDGHIYSQWAGSGNIFTRSVDGGQSFQSPTSIPQRPRWGTMDVGPNGTLWVSGTDGGSGYLVSRSTNAQNAAVTPTFTTQSVNLGGSVSFFTGPNPGGLLGQSWIAVDPSSGPTAGWIYLLSSVDPPGSDPLDVHFIRSEDGGATWTAPVRVNDDGGNGYQWFGTMSVAPNGRIDVIWNDTRNSATINVSELFYSFSTDGGSTWSANVQMSGAWNSFVGWPQQDKIGDYYHMNSDLVGADLAWAATFNGEQDVYHLRINDYDCNQNGVGDAIDIFNGVSTDTNGNGIPDECEVTVDVPGVVSQFELLRNAPNPFGVATTIEFDVSDRGVNASLRVFDVDGRLVRQLVNGRVQAGRNTFTWDGTDDKGHAVAPGVFFYRLDAPGFSETRRMMLLR